MSGAKKCSNCGKALTGKSYLCKLCDTEVCPDCLAHGKILGTKKCKRCCGLLPANKSAGAKERPATATSTAAGSPKQGAATNGNSESSAAKQATEKEAKPIGKGSKIGNMLHVGSSFDASMGGMVDMEDETLKFGWDLYALLNVKIIEASGLPAADVNVLGTNSSDPYTIVTLMDDGVSRKSTTVKQTLNPVWNYDCTTMVVDVPCQKLQVQVFDYDMTSDDDILGTATVDLTNLISGQPTNGWIPLEGEDGEPAGAIHLELEIMYTPNSERIAFIQEAMVSRPQPKPKFNINELYGPGMFMGQVIWFDLLQPFLMEQVLPVLMWENWMKSILVTVGFMYASYFAAYWPAFACWGLAIAMVRNKVLKGYERFMANKPMTTNFDKSGKAILMNDDDDDSDAPQEQSFNGLIKTFTRLSPGWVKEMAAGFQPLVRQLADLVTMARDIILWRHALSKTIFYALLAAGVVLCFLPFWIVVMGAGSGVLLANSPFKGLSIGLAQATARPRPTGDLGFLDAMEESHMSEDFRKQYLKKQRKQRQ